MHDSCLLEFAIYAILQGANILSKTNTPPKLILMMFHVKHHNIVLVFIERLKEHIFRIVINL